MEDVIHFGLEEVLNLISGRPRYDQLLVVPGKGTGIVGAGTQPSFEEKVRELDAQIAAGTMEQRDWKCRYDGHDFTETGGRFALVVKMGPTSWGEWREDYERSQEEAAALQALGQSKHHDRGFYLSNGLGAAVLTVTREGDIVVGVRRSDSYDGKIHGAAGWLAFDRNPSNINPIKDAYRELEEELAIRQDHVSSLHLVGLVAYAKTLEADFVFVAKTDKERDYFTSGAWKEAVDAREHRNLIVLNQPPQIRQLLEEGKAPDGENKYEVTPSTAYGLEVLARHWDKLHE